MYLSNREGITHVNTLHICLGPASLLVNDQSADEVR